MEVNIPTSIGRRLEEFFLRISTETNNQTPSQSSVLAGDHIGSKFLFIGYIRVPYNFTIATSSSSSSSASASSSEYIYIYCYYCYYYYQYLVDEFGQNMGGFHPVIVLVVAIGRKNLRYCIRYSEKDLPMFTMHIYIYIILFELAFLLTYHFFRFFMLLRDQQSRNSERCVVLVHPSMVLVHPSSYQQCFPWFCSA